MRVVDDLAPAYVNHEPDLRGSTRAAFACRNRISVFSATSSLLASTSTSTGRGKRSARARDGSAQPGFQRSRPGCPDQPMPIIQRPQDPLHLRSPALARVRAVLGRAERVIGDEHLRGAGIERRARHHPGGCTRAPPSRPSAAPARSSERSPSCPSPADRSTQRTGARQHPERPAIGACRHEHSRESPRRCKIQRRAGRHFRVDQLIELAQPEDRRDRAAQLGSGVQRFPISPRPRTRTFTRPSSPTRREPPSRASRSGRGSSAARTT